MVIIKKLCFLLFIFSFTWSCTNCEYQMKSYIEPLEFNGVIIKKYIDYDDHLNPKVIIDNGIENKLFLPVEKFSGKGFFEYIQVRDSVFKKKDSRIIQTKRLNESKEFVFRCID